MLDSVNLITVNKQIYVYKMVLIMSQTYWNNVHKTFSLYNILANILNLEEFVNKCVCVDVSSVHNLISLTLRWRVKA